MLKNWNDKMRIVILKTSIRKTFTGTLSLLPDIREYAGVKIWKLILILTLITNIDYIYREGTQPHPSEQDQVCPTASPSH